MNQTKQKDDSFYSEPPKYKKERLLIKSDFFNLESLVK